MEKTFIILANDIKINTDQYNVLQLIKG